MFLFSPARDPFDGFFSCSCPAGPELRVVLALEEEEVVVVVVVDAVAAVVVDVVVVVVVEISLSPIFEYAFLSSLEWSLAPRVVSHSNETIT